jgi:hypothetical protein
VTFGLFHVMDRSTDAIGSSSCKVWHQLRTVAVELLPMSGGFIETKALLIDRAPEPMLVAGEG